MKNEEIVEAVTGLQAQMVAPSQTFIKEDAEAALRYITYLEKENSRLRSLVDHLAEHNETETLISMAENIERWQDAMAKVLQIVEEVPQQVEKTFEDWGD